MIKCSAIYAFFVNQLICDKFFGWVGNEALSACKTIAELWDDRLRGGDIGLVSAAGGRMSSS